MTDILEIIRPHVHLERQGKNYVGLCPFHQEKTPSFTVDPSDRLFAVWVAVPTVMPGSLQN